MLGVLTARDNINSSRDRVDEARSNARACIELKGKTSECERIDKKLLDEDTVRALEPVLDLHKAFLAQKQSESIEKRKNAELKQKEVDAAFRAEGWWEQRPGIFLRWCTDQNPCPGPRGNGYSDYNWRAMVWCKERACGNIYAKMNILQGDTVIGWTNDTAYGDAGQKVVLTFGSSKQGEGRIVEFVARG